MTLTELILVSAAIGVVCGVVCGVAVAALVWWWGRRP